MPGEPVLAGLARGLLETGPVPVLQPGSAEGSHSPTACSAPTYSRAAGELWALRTGGSEHPVPPEPLPAPQGSPAGGRVRWVPCAQDGAGPRPDGPLYIRGQKPESAPLTPPWKSSVGLMSDGVALDSAGFVCHSVCQE